MAFIGLLSIGIAGIGLLSIAGFVVFLVLLVVNLIRKKSKKISAIGLPICVVLFFVAVMLTPTEESPPANSRGESGNLAAQAGVAETNVPDEIAPPESVEPEPVVVKYALGETFILDGYEITFFDEIEWLLITDERAIFRIPLSITNFQDSRAASNSWSDIFQYGPNGMENRVGNSARHQFDFTTEWNLNFMTYDVGRFHWIDDGETIRKYMHFQYDGEGDYAVEIVARQGDDNNVMLNFPVPEVPRQPTHKPTPPPSGVNAETYGYLKTGMPISQVRTIIGIEPSSESTSTMEILGTQTHITILTWTQSNPLRSITIVFSGDYEFNQTATSISSTNLN